MIVKVGKNRVILPPQDNDFREENTLKIGDILLCTVMENNRAIKLEKFSDQSLTDAQIKAHGSLCRVEEFNPDDF